MDRGRYDDALPHLRQVLSLAPTNGHANFWLVQPLYLVSRTRPTGWLQQLIDFTLSPAGQAIVARYHGRVR